MAMPNTPTPQHPNTVLPYFPSPATKSQNAGSSDPIRHSAKPFKPSFFADANFARDASPSEKNAVLPL